VRSTIALALVLVACTRDDKPNSPIDRSASTPSAARGADALVLRVPRRGGPARVTAYPNIDSVVWAATDSAPALERVLAFDADAGLVAAADTRAFPFWLDLRADKVIAPNRRPVRGLISVDGTTIYGVGPDGKVARFTPSGNWLFTPPAPGRFVFPQLNGTLLILGGRDASSRAWRIHPPDSTLRDSLSIPDASGGTGATLGDRVYVITGKRTLVGVHPRAMTRGSAIEFDHQIIAVAGTPSGDRFYVLTDSSRTLDVVSRYQDRLSGRIELPGRGRDLRVDPFGRYVLVRAAVGDSVWVVGIGADKVVGSVRSAWRSDLPFVAPDGVVAVIDDGDVAFIEPTSLKEVRRSVDGASDFWYPFVWSGFRPRAVAVDQPPGVAADSDTVSVVVPPVTRDTVATPAPTIPDSTKLGFTVSFAALLDEAKAAAEAAKIVVEGKAARVVTSVTSGTAVYRIVLGPYATREEAERAGRASGQSYVVYAGSP
jgi:cell division septation protein DedD